MKNKTTSVTTEFPEELVTLLDQVAAARTITRSALIRQLVLEGLSRLSYLPENTKKALGNPGRN
jgi:metal-responsive CopG/Arc/MetJ family transcriptional regulator